MKEEEKVPMSGEGAEETAVEAEDAAAETPAEDKGAEERLAQAEAKAEDVSKNTMTEISLAGKQAVGRIKSEIASLIIAKATARGVKEAVVDPAFIKEMLVAVAKNWNGSDSGKVELQALLPEGERKKLDAAFEESAKELLEDFHGAVDDYLELCRAEGKTPETAYKGSFNVRISPELHKQLAVYAMEHDVSLNHCVEQALEKALAQK